MKKHKQVALKLIRFETFILMQYFIYTFAKGIWIFRNWSYTTFDNLLDPGIAIILKQLVFIFIGSDKKAQKHDTSLLKSKVTI